MTPRPGKCRERLDGEGRLGVGGLAGLAAPYSSAAGAAVPLAQRVFTAEFGMGSGVWPLAMATRPANPPFDGSRAGTHGLESMREPFLTARIVVVLYREPWGNTNWTRVEQA